MAEYLAIPALSSGIARTLIDDCARRAWFMSHLNPDRVREDTEATDRGTIAHAVLLEGGTDCVVVIDPSDHPAEKTGAIPTGWTNKSIRAARDLARSEGLIPMLSDDFKSVYAMVTEARRYIESLEETEPAIKAAFDETGGESEVTLVWLEGETLCKLRADRVSIAYDLCIDFKTSAMSVEPDRWGRTQLVNQGYYFGAAWYRRGFKALCGTEPDYVFLCQEVESPYLCSLVGLDPAISDLGDRKVAMALRHWAGCVQRDRWPAYPTRVCYPELPAYESARFEEKEVIDYGSQA